MLKVIFKRVCVFLVVRLVLYNMYVEKLEDFKTGSSVVVEVYVVQ